MSSDSRAKEGRLRANRGALRKEEILEMNHGSIHGEKRVNELSQRDPRRRIPKGKEKLEFNLANAGSMILASDLLTASGGIERLAGGSAARR